MKLNSIRSGKRFAVYSAILVTIAVCLLVCSFTFAGNTASARLGSNGAGNSSSQADVDINGGKDIISIDDYVFEPGMKVTKNYYIKNNDDSPVYYGFTDVTGNLADYLTVTLVSGGNVLYSGSASGLADFNLDKGLTLSPDEQEDFTITFEYPANSGNGSQNLEFNFRVCCDYTN